MEADPSVAPGPPVVPGPPVSPGRAAFSQKQWLWLLPIVIVAAGVRFYALDASSLWSDEGNTWALVQRSFSEIARDAAADIHPPGYYWLLKIWTLVGGTSAYTLRAFSALCGVLVVVGVYGVARQLPFAAFSGRGQPVGEVSALLAAWIVALNPLQIYYSQEARMYMPLALAGVGLFGSLLAYTRREQVGRPRWQWGLAFWAWGVAGLWLHYSFPILLLAAGLYYLWQWRDLYRQQGRTAWRALARFVGVSIAIGVAFLPWLPTALRQILSWPQGDVPTGPGAGLRLTLTTLLHGPLTPGPLASGPDAQFLWLAAAGVLPLLGIWAAQRARAQARTAAVSQMGTQSVQGGAALALWLLTPIAMMFALGLFSDAFLKFLLVAAPAWAIAVAWSAQLPALRGEKAARLGVYALSVLLAGGALWLAVATLPGYYADPTARDNYAGVARYITAQRAHADQPLVVLNAPGQRDVWNYYDPGLPVLALPAARPPDPAATEAALIEAARNHDRIFALYWATDEADPAGIVENWLDTHTFPGLESWQGNLRFVDYSLPQQLVCTQLGEPVTFGDANPTGAAQSSRLEIRLVETCRDASGASAQATIASNVAAGNVVVMGLTWQVVSAPLDASTGQLDPIAASLQLLDARNQVIAQRDAPLPVVPGTHDAPPVRDNHGIPIPVGTPPGDYRLVLALYYPITGQRLVTSAGDAWELGVVHIQRAPPVPDPLIAADIAVQRALGPVTLLGYDLHRKDYAHAPDTPVAPGDSIQITFYWQAPPTLPADWPVDLHFDLRLGGEQLSAPLAGGGYPTQAWQPQEVVRARFEMIYTGDARRPQLDIGADSYTLRAVP
ncbi:MAG: glycosyltransferase family 39 protein [Litorilinea sp.]